MANIDETVSQAGEQASQAAENLREKGRRVLHGEGYDRAREYVERGRSALSDSSENLRDFVRREPWLALAGAFVVGYVAAQFIKRMR